jgi:subtilase family serine protease
VGLETSLDVEMAHAMAPKANILLVEVPATVSVANEFRELLHGGQLAAGQSVNGAPVVVVSTSYGFSEQQIGNANVVSLNNTFLTTGPSTTVAMTFSTGDGSTPLFPATSPNVIGVGGTALYLASARGRYSEEIAWGGLAGAGAGGGGTSTNFTVPTFQSLNTVNFSGKRSIPDISMNADVVTAASVFDSFDQASNGGDPWQGVGGTSEASPLFAGVLALAQQRRLAASLPILNSVQINNILYAAYTSANYLTYFHDITLGNNSNVDGSGTTTVAGFNAGARYDLATGIGSPIVNTLVPLLSEQNPTP